MNIYKTTNVINGMVFIGYSLNDNVQNLGTGKYITKAIKQYGSENFKKEILQTFEELDIAELMDRMEYYIKCYKSDDPKFGYNETINESKPQKKKLTNKIQVLLSQDDEERLNDLIIKESMLEHKKPVSVSNFVRQLILNKINENR